MADALTSIIARIIAERSRFTLSQLLEEYNNIVFSGNALCTNWGTYRANGREMLACMSVLYVVEYLRAIRAIRVRNEGDDRVIEVANSDMLRQLIERRV